MARSYHRAAFLGWLSGTAFFAVTMHWIYSTCRFASVPIPVAFLAWAVLSGVLGASWVVFGALVRWIHASTPAWSWPWAFASTWTVVEWMCSYSHLGIFQLGYTQWRFPSWIQGTAWTGTNGLSFLIVLVNSILVLWLKTGFGVLTAAGNRNRMRSTSIAAALVLAWWSYGIWSLKHRMIVGESVSVVILQPNVDQYQKWDSNYVAGIRAGIDRLVDMASRAPAPAKPRLILWPESSVPGWLNDPENFQWVQAVARRTQTPQLIGAITRTKGQEHNSAILLEPDGKINGIYHKRQLVPFGEFVPLRSMFAPWVGILDQMGDFLPGAPEQSALESPLGRLGVTICYEAVYPRWTRLDAGRGARVIANLTNDGWYKDTWGPYQHFYANIFRAVENRVTVLRAANTGISGVIGPYGIVTHRLDLNQKGVLFASIPMRDIFPSGSFYSRWGDWFAKVNALALILLALWRKIR